MNSKWNATFQESKNLLKIFLNHFWPILGVLLFALILEIGYFWISPPGKGISFSFKDASYAFEASLAREGNEILYPVDDQITRVLREAVEQKEINEFIGWLRSSPEIAYNVEAENHLTFEQFSGTSDAPVLVTSTEFTLKCTPPGNAGPIEILPGQREKVLSAIRISEIAQEWRGMFCAVSNVGDVIDSDEIVTVRLGGSLVLVPSYTDKSWWIFYILS